MQFKSALMPQRKTSEFNEERGIIEFTKRDDEILIGNHKGIARSIAVRMQHEFNMAQ